ncbi:Dienelactone hydrolase family protein [Roseivivax jejudonensis]|uniref:Dienelactone hydrolase family protein n=1 Tax=Roseivivax jejudonensis TaxID=1529041 RepID=A0A1X6YX63_9RHOB|nr:dienelactone hydrolase family protein [Roseivivax jejudonensis]SLN31891.1 Dienelactone hydrolase family protein [Roseivivax jejudonensis]
MTRRFLLWTLIVVLALSAAFVLNALRGRLGWTATTLSPAELSEQLSPGFTWTRPEGDGPFPAALLLSGCDGPQDNVARLAARLAEAGWLSLNVDSHGPRELDDRQMWRLVCAGQLLNGAERAADIAVALAALRARDDVDPERIALIGMSHGGWATLDFLVLSEAGTVPPLLTEWPATLPARRHAGIRGVVLYYPYCGQASLASVSDLPTDLGYRFLLVEEDTIVDERECLEVAGSLLAHDADVAVTLYEGVTHSFDQQDISFLSPLEFDRDATERAIAETLRFLDTL